MDTLTSLRVFRQVAESGSFSGAAERIGVSPAMASKHVAHLERQLRARLFNRSSRHVSLTEAGSLFYESCRVALDSLDGAAASLSEGHVEPRGQLRITAPIWCATPAFTGLLAAYRERHPQVLLDLRLTNEKVDLAEGAFDLALRVTNEPSPSLIVRPICMVPFQVVAAPAYVAAHRHAARHATGTTAMAAVVASYLPTSGTLPPAVGESAGSGLPRQPQATGSRQHGRERRSTSAAMLKVDAVLRTDNTHLMHQAVRAGLGVAFLPLWLVGEDLAAGRLVSVPGAEPVAVTLHAAYTSRMYLTPKVRSFIDFLAAALAEAPQKAAS